VRARALVIGINLYPASAGQDPLFGAVDDAADFATWALDPLGGGVAADDLYFWTHPAPAPLPAALAAHSGPDRPWPCAPPPDFAAAPTSQAIILAARDAADSAAESDEDERLYLFFAGHGVVTKKIGEDAQSCYMAGDFIANTSFGLIPLDDLRRAIAERGPRETILICDCCRNALPITIPKPVLNIDESDDLEINQQWLHGSAAKLKAPAWEVPEGAPRRGAFTKMLVQALRQYRVDDELTVDAAKGFVRKAVARLVDPKTQVPGLQVRDDAEPYVIVAGPPIPPFPDLVVAFPPGLVGSVRILDARDEPVGEPIEIVAGSIRRPLPPGQYTIEHVATGRDVQLFHPGPEPTHERFPEDDQ
jgi:hypothetical protein